MYVPLFDFSMNRIFISYAWIQAKVYITVRTKKGMITLGEQFMLKVPRDRFEEGSQLVEGKLVKTDGYRWSVQKPFIEKLREKLSK